MLEKVGASAVVSRSIAAYDLPLDVLIVIFKMNTLHLKDLNSCSLVCKKWRIVLIQNPIIFKRFVNLLSQYFILKSNADLTSREWKLMKQCKNTTYEVLVDVSESMCVQKFGSSRKQLSPLLIEAIENLVYSLLPCVHRVSLFPFSADLGGCFQVPDKYSLRQILTQFNNCVHRKSNLNIITDKLISFYRNYASPLPKSLFVITDLCFDKESTVRFLKIIDRTNYFSVLSGNIFKLIFIEINIKTHDNFFKNKLNQLLKNNPLITYVHTLTHATKVGS